MGNCCSSNEQFMTLVIKDGQVHECLVCTRCHRPDHSRKNCYANTYSDGSLIRQICRNCGMYHTNDKPNCLIYS